MKCYINRWVNGNHMYYSTSPNGLNTPFKPDPEILLLLSSNYQLCMCLILVQRWFNVGSTTLTLTQWSNNVWPTTRVYWSKQAKYYVDALAHPVSGGCGIVIHYCPPGIYPTLFLYLQDSIFIPMDSFAKLRYNVNIILALSYIVTSPTIFARGRSLHDILHLLTV